MSATKMKLESFEPSILIFEDDISVSKSIVSSFEKFGFKALVKNNIDDFRKSLSKLNVDACMVDINLSKTSDSSEINGLDILKYIKKEMKNIPLIGYSSYIRTKLDEFEKYPIFEKSYVKDNNVAFENEELIKSIHATIVEKWKREQDLKKKPPADDKPHSTIIQLDPIDSKLYSALVQSPELLQSLDWRLFEKLLADILVTFNYKVELMRGTKDGGIDIIAIAEHEDWGDQKYLLQAKRWKNRVGIESVQQLLFLHGAELATKSCLATTSTFTRGAWQLGNQYQWQLELRDYNGIQEWINRAYKIRSGL